MRGDDDRRERFDDERRPGYGPGDDGDEAPPQWLAPLQRRRTWLVGGVLVAVFVAFGGVVWLAYQDGGAAAIGDVPVVAADARPFKVAPDDRGGLEVPNQRMTVNVLLGSEPPPADAPEPVTPAPAEPDVVPPPEPEPAAEAAGVTAPAGVSRAEAADRPEPTPRAEEPEGPTLGEVVAEDAAGPTLGEVVAQDEQPPAVTAPEEARPEPPQPETTPARAVETETVAVTPPTVDEAEEPAATSGPSFRIQLAAVRDEARARQAWSELQATYRDVLDGLEARIQRAEVGDAVFFRIQAGPFDSREAANEVCAALKARQAACIVVNG